MRTLHGGLRWILQITRPETATAKGSFSFRYDDGSLSVKGITDSALPTHQLEQYGTMGLERNGFFVHLH
jgi:hypothetical protein